MTPATFVAPPRLLFSHTPAREFIGPGLARLPSGDLLMIMSWMRGRDNKTGTAIPITEDTPKNRAHRFTSKDNGRTWTDAGPLSLPWTISGIPIEQCSLLRLRDNRVMALFHRTTGRHQGGGMPAISFSSGDGKTWTSARLLDPQNEGEHYIMNNRIVQTRDGRIVVPFSHVPPSSEHYEGRWSVAFIYASDDFGQTWKRSASWSSFANMEPQNKWDGMQEPAFAELADGRYLMMCRTGRGAHHKTLSTDAGQTWSQPIRTSLTSPCAPLSLTRLPDERLFIVYNHAYPTRPGSLFPRTPLVFATSSDEGDTWSAPTLIDDVPNSDVIYAAIACVKEGITLVYSTHLCPGHDFHLDEEYFRKYWQTGGAKSCILAYPT